MQSSERRAAPRGLVELDVEIAGSDGGFEKRRRASEFFSLQTAN
jgi:hypothetical protein